jgi:Xaa-Pro aminopeptidase
MRSVRRLKSPEEVDQLRRAGAVAEASVHAAAACAAPGRSEHEMQAAFLARMYELGATAYAASGPCVIVDPGSCEPLGGRRLIEQDSLVSVSGGVLLDGYEGCVGRTWWCGSKGRRPAAHQTALYHRWRAVMDAVVGGCVPGATGADLARVHAEASGADRGLVVRSVGMGAEGTIAGTGLGEEFEKQQSIAPAMVLSIRVALSTSQGDYRGEDMIHVDADGTELLTKLSGGPLAAAAPLEAERVPA